MRRRAWLLACAAALGGCAVGPDFRRPDAPALERYTREPLPGGTAAADAATGGAQRFLQGGEVRADWWTLFGSRELNALVESALANNPGVLSAQAALRKAQALARAQEGRLFPVVTAGYARTRAKDSDALGSVLAQPPAGPYTLHTAQVAVGYVPDVFGGLQRQAESARAQAEAQRFVLEATYLTLTTNVVAAAVQEASLRAQLAAARDVVRANARSLEILRRQFDAGQVAGLDVRAQEAALAQSEQAVPPLQRQLEQVHDLIAALCGRFPSDAGPTLELSALGLPQELPVSVPSKLVEQRPDVRAAESLLHAASADVGAATANLLPQFSITAARGGAATAFGQMLAGGNPFWSVAGGVAQTLFAGGTLRAQKRAAEAAYDQAAADYRAAVIAAVQNVADVLYALQADADALAAAARSERAARSTLDVVQRQLEVGQVNVLALLNAQQAHQQALAALAQARAARLADTAALFQALGGGWWNRTGGAPAAPAKE